MMLDPNLVLLIIAVVNAFTAWITWRTHQATKATQLDIRKVELATNSMKDALVKSTAEASEAKGRDDERALAEAKAAKLIDDNK